MSSTVGGEMEVRLPRRVLEGIHAHARETYPEECCGFLLGREQRSVRTVTEGLRSRNVHPDLRESRYTIDPRDVLEVERRCRGTETGILGFYHSHPRHPAQPSSFDQERAWPRYVYLIVGLEIDVPGEVTAWSFDPERRALLPVPVRVL